MMLISGVNIIRPKSARSRAENSSVLASRGESPNSSTPLLFYYLTNNMLFSCPRSQHMGDNGASPEDQSGAKECHGDNASKFQRTLQRRRSQKITMLVYLGEDQGAPISLLCIRSEYLGSCLVCHKTRLTTCSGRDMAKIKKNILHIMHIYIFLQIPFFPDEMPSCHISSCLHSPLISMTLL